MKQVIYIFLVLIAPLVASAQGFNLYADAGICLSYLDPGSSVTYNYNFNKHLSLGAGVQEYTFHTTLTNVHQLTSAVFGEFRCNMKQRKKGQYFSFLDLGINCYRNNNSEYHNGDYIYTVPGNNGFYAGLGYGYMHYTTKQKGGPYVSLKMITNWYKSDRYDLYSGVRDTGHSSDGTLVVSAGFKF